MLQDWNLSLIHIYKKFLREIYGVNPIEGDIVDRNGRVLGKHKGLYGYTVGQRRGLGIANAVPLFVTGFNREKNQLIVGEADDLLKDSMICYDINLLLIDKLEVPTRVMIKTRSVSYTHLDVYKRQSQFKGDYPKLFKWLDENNII